MSDQIKKGLYCDVEVTTDMARKQIKTCFTHEVPILQAKHGEGNVLPVKTDNKYKPIDLLPSAEYKRLEKVYGTNDDGLEYVALIYGNLHTGTISNNIGKPLKDFGGVDMKKEIDLTLSEEDQAQPEPKPEVKKGPQTQYAKGNPTKAVLVKWLKANKLEFDETLNAGDLANWADGNIRLMVGAMKLNAEIPEGIQVKGLIELFAEVQQDAAA